MIRTRLLLASVAALAVAAAAFLSYQPAEAASALLCRPDVAGAATGPGIWVAPGTTSSYQLDGRGCGRINFIDIGDARAQGFVSTPGDNYLVGVNFGVTSASAGTSIVPASPFTLTLPPAAVIKHIIVQETSGSAVTGDMKIGTTSHGQEVATGIVVAASSLFAITDASLFKRVFSATAQQTLYFDARASTWNNAAVSITVIYSFF